MFALGIALSVLIGVSLGFFGGGGSILTVPLLVYVFGLGPKGGHRELTAHRRNRQHLGSHAALARRECSPEGRSSLRRGRNGRCLPRWASKRLPRWRPSPPSFRCDDAPYVDSDVARKERRRPGRRRRAPVSPAKLTLQGFAVGSFTGLVGAGGGFLIVPALALWAGLPMTAAVGTSLLIIVLKSATGFLGYLSHVEVKYSLVAMVSGTAIAGSFLGSRLATFASSRSRSVVLLLASSWPWRA